MSSQSPVDQPLSTYDGGPLGSGIDWSDPHSPLAPYYLTRGGILAAVVLGCAFFLLSLPPLWHTDFWVHLKYGQWIVEHRSLPQYEPLSPFTDKQRPMFDAMWLTQVGYYQLFRWGETLAGGDRAQRLAGGVELIRLLHTIVAVAAVGFVGLACRRVANSVLWASLAMLFLLVAMLTPLTVQRPQLFGFLCFAILLALISRPILTRWASGIIPLVMVVWANGHGSFVVGFGLLGLFLIGRALDVWRDHEDWWGKIVRDQAIHRLLVALILSLAAVAILNPYGPHIYIEVSRFGSHPNLRSFAEWQPLNFSQPTGGHWLYLATVALLVLTQLVSPKSFSPLQLLLIVTFGVWPLFQQRAMTWWLPLVPWIAAPHWVAATERWGWSGPTSIPDFRRTVLAILLLILAVIVSPASIWLKTGSPRSVPAALHAGTPYDVAAVLQGEPAASSERVREFARTVRQWYGDRYIGRVFTSEVLGEYLLWSLPADTPVLMFNHAQLFPENYWADCLRVKSGGPGWWEFLDRMRVNVVVVEVAFHPALCEEIRHSTRWAVVLDESTIPARDGYSRLFVAVRRPEEAPRPVAPMPHEPKRNAP
ncbi:MAG: hypothetical protein RMJ56_01355 [Gemmataceae bacterium]|nr:hypothetical protein [Gemmata sp.]MDW8196228.1 hypothetical protein [Gemmataceae bacterium]